MGRQSYKKGGFVCRCSMRGIGNQPLDLACTLTIPKSGLGILPDFCGKGNQPDSAEVEITSLTALALSSPSATPDHGILKKMRYYPSHRTSRSLRSARTVRFPNDVLFLDHIRQGDLEQVGRFIRARKVTLDTIYLTGMGAIHEAVLSGNLECVKLLVKYGADIEQRDENGWTPLHMACSDAHPHIARYLLSLGAEKDVVNSEGEKPCELIDSDCEELVQIFSTNEGK